jgi:hypothetical protein
MANSDGPGCALLEYVRRVEFESFAKCVDVFDVDEWRVAFSGQLYPRGLLGKHRGAWSQARLLMEDPFEVVTCVGLPRHGHEQLCVRFPTLAKEEKSGKTTIIGANSREILDEFLSVVCLLTRVPLRIITRAATYVAPHYLRQDFGDPQIRRMDRIIDARMPQALVGFLDDETQVAQACCDLDGKAFGAFLQALAHDPSGDVFVAAARAFATAIELQDRRPEVAYLLLVSSVEALASVAYDGWAPTLDEIKEARGPLVKAANDLSLCDAQAESLVRASCAGDQWAARKFRRYLAEHIARPVVCPGLTYIRIEPNKIPAVARAIYQSRSTMTHRAGALPATASYGGGPTVDVRSAAALMEAAADGWAPDQVPPVAWFLCAVALAHRTFVCKRLEIEQCPAGECTEDDAVAETP